MTKKLESSKATAKHIKQHTSTMQGAAHINVLQHNHTSLPPKKKKGRRKPNPSRSNKPQQPQQQKQSKQHQPFERNPNQCTRFSNSPHAQGFTCLAKKYQCKYCTKIGHFTKMCFAKTAHQQPQHYQKSKPKQAHLLDVKPQLNYLPPRATLISSAVDYPKKEIHAQFTSKQQQQGITTSKPSRPQEDTLKKIGIIKTKEQIQEQYPELFEGIG